jgi:hypothetical protein
MSKVTEPSISSQPRSRIHSSGNFVSTYCFPAGSRVLCRWSR